MTSIIVFIPYQMFPVAMLPERALLALCASRSHEIRTIQTGATALRHGAFDDPPTRREITVVGRQCPDTMQMIWQQHPGVGGERMGLPHQRNTFPQCRSDIVIQQEGLAAQGVDSKEIRSTVNIDAPVVRHAGIIFDRRVIRALRLLQGLEAEFFDHIFYESCAVGVAINQPQFDPTPGNHFVNDVVPRRVVGEFINQLVSGPFQI